MLEISYSEWLKKEWKVCGYSENLHDEYKTTAAINYSFEDDTAFDRFLKEFNLGLASTLDPLTQKFAVVIDKPSHEKLIRIYRASAKTPSSKKITDQLEAIRTCFESFKPDERNPSQQNVSLRNLNAIQPLTLNKKSESAYPVEATRGMQLALNNYLALYQDILSEAELRCLKGIKRIIEVQIEADVNWFDFIYKHWFEVCGQKKDPLEYDSIAAHLRGDPCDLLDGTSYRRPFPRGGSHEKFEQLTRLVGSGEDTSSLGFRPVPRFFPNEEGDSETDVIFLDAGNMQGHRTLLKIWKRGINFEGKPTTPGEIPAAWEFFATEYNTGAGAEPAAEKIVWAVNTKQIFPVWAKASSEMAEEKEPTFSKEAFSLKEWSSYKAVMYATLERFIFSHRLIRFYKPEHEKWKYYHRQIVSCLGPRIDTQSRKGVAQRSENCTVMSLHALIGDENFWFFCKKFNAAETFALLMKKRATLEQIRSPQTEEKNGFSKIMLEESTAKETLFELVEKENFQEEDFYKMQFILNQFPSLLNSRSETRSNEDLLMTVLRQIDHHILEIHSLHFLFKVAHFIISHRDFNPNATEEKSGSTSKQSGLTLALELYLRCVYNGFKIRPYYPNVSKSEEITPFFFDQIEIYGHFPLFEGTLEDLFKKLVILGADFNSEILHMMECSPPKLKKFVNSYQSLIKDCKEESLKKSFIKKLMSTIDKGAEEREWDEVFSCLNQLKEPDKIILSLHELLKTKKIKISAPFTEIDTDMDIDVECAKFMVEKISEDPLNSVIMLLFLNSASACFKQDGTILFHNQAKLKSLIEICNYLLTFKRIHLNANDAEARTTLTRIFSLCNHLERKGEGDFSKEFLFLSQKLILKTDHLEVISTGKPTQLSQFLDAYKELKSTGPQLKEIFTRKISDFLNEHKEKNTLLFMEKLKPIKNVDVCLRNFSKFLIEKENQESPTASSISERIVKVHNFLIQFAEAIDVREEAIKDVSVQKEYETMKEEIKKIKTLFQGLPQSETRDLLFSQLTQAFSEIEILLPKQRDLHLARSASQLGFFSSEILNPTDISHKKQPTTTQSPTLSSPQNGVTTDLYADHQNALTTPLNKIAYSDPPENLK